MLSILLLVIIVIVVGKNEIHMCDSGREILNTFGSTTFAEEGRALSSRAQGTGSIGADAGGGALAAGRSPCRSLPYNTGLC